MLSILLIAGGGFLYATTMVQVTDRSFSKSWASSTSFENTFEYSDAVLTPDNPPRVTIGSSGVSTLIVLKTPFRDFSNYVCEQGHYEPTPDQCNFFGGGNGFNITILDSYLQSHHPEIALSKTLVNENVTLNYPVTTTTAFTLVLAQLGPGVTRTYWEYTRTNATQIYSLLGYRERPGTLLSLPNISLALITGGVASLIVALIVFKPAAPIQFKKHEEPATS